MIDSKIVKVDPEKMTDFSIEERRAGCKQEFTLELSGRITVYGDDSRQDFEMELAEIIEKYAI